MLYLPPDGTPKAAVQAIHDVLPGGLQRGVFQGVDADDVILLAGDFLHLTGRAPASAARTLSTGGRLAKVTVISAPPGSRCRSAVPL